MSQALISYFPIEMLMNCKIRTQSVFSMTLLLRPDKTNYSGGTMIREGFHRIQYVAADGNARSPADILNEVVYLFETNGEAKPCTRPCKHIYEPLHCFLCATRTAVSANSIFLISIVPTWGST